MMTNQLRNLTSVKVLIQWKIWKMDNKINDWVVMCRKEVKNGNIYLKKQLPMNDNEKLFLRTLKELITSVILLKVLHYWEVENSKSINREAICNKINGEWFLEELREEIDLIENYKCLKTLQETCFAIIYALYFVFRMYRYTMSYFLGIDNWYLTW